MKRSLTFRGFFPDALSLNVGFSQTLLLRGALITGVLAIIAGIFGMHVLTGNHAAHGTHASVGHAAPVQVAPVADVHVSAAHAAHGHAEAPHAEPQEQTVRAAVPAGATSCGGSCQGMQESGTSCIPSAQAGALTLFPPHRTGVAFHPAEASKGPAAAYAYLRPSPTPCDLSISRT
jgi:hypothetical protein